MSSPQATAQPTAGSRTAAVEVSLLTGNARTTGAFYARLLGRDVEVLEQRVIRVADCLVFRQAEGTELRGTEQSLVSFTVPDLEQSARQLHAPITRGAHGVEVRGQDPDGRWVVLRQATQTAPSGDGHGPVQAGSR